MSGSTELREVRASTAEMKFHISRSLAGEIRDWARASMSPDPNASGATGGAYQITSLYFDTENFDVFYRRGSFGRSKYRIRRYDSSELAFLERKLKNRGLVSKWRTVVQMDDLERLARAETDQPWPGYWYHRRILARRLKPVCQISYHRTALVATTTSGPVRLTLDDHVNALPVRGPAFDSGGEPAMLSNGHCILELKYRSEPPAIFKRLMEGFKLTQQPVSKYRLAAAALGYGKEECPTS